MRISLLLAIALTLCAQTPADPILQEQTARLRALVAQAPRLPLARTEFVPEAPREGWEVGMVSSVASDGRGTIYLLQRGDKADPVVAVNRQGRVLRSWGKGLYKIPHSIRIDPEGNVWTVDAASSVVLKFTPEGKKLLEIAVGGQPEAHRSPFCGTTDIAFAPGGRIFISDGYANARILEYTRGGKRVREWGAPGTGQGQFRLPHGIAADENGILYAADRENGRIQRFDLDGRYLGEWSELGKTFALTIADGALWIATQPRNEPNGAPGWLMKVDRATGKVLGTVDSIRQHSIHVLPGGELLSGPGPERVLWFRAAR